MTVRQSIHRAWLAALLGGTAALAQEPLPLPPLAGATPIPVPTVVPPLTPATGTTPVVPPGTVAPVSLPPLAPEPPKSSPVIPPPVAPMTPSLPTAPPAATPSKKPMPPAIVPEPMAPMPSAAPTLPPMNITIETKPTTPAPTPALPAPKAPDATAKAPVLAPVNPMAPATPPSFESAPVVKPASASVTIGKPAIDGLAAYGMMLAEAKIALGKINDYSGHVIHQDRIRGKLTVEQTAEIRVKAKPASVALKYVAPNVLMGQELAYISGRNGGKVRMKPAGNFSPAGFVSLDLTDPRATAHTRHAITEIGIQPIVELLEKNLNIEQRLRNAVQVTVSEYVYANRPVTRFEVFTDRAHALRYAYRTVVYVDKETKLPIRMEAYDQPSIGGSPLGELLECYSYVNLKFNQGLGDAVFEK